MNARDEQERFEAHIDKFGSEAPEPSDDHGYPSLHAAAIDWLFKPGEGYDDVFMRKLFDVAEFVRAQPCTCTPEGREDFDLCDRCTLLNDEGRGR